MNGRVAKKLRKKAHKSAVKVVNSDEHKETLKKLKASQKPDFIKVVARNIYRALKNKYNGRTSP